MKTETLFKVGSFESENYSVRQKVYNRVDCNVNEGFTCRTKVFDIKNKKSATIDIVGTIASKTNSMFYDSRSHQPKLLITYNITPNENTIAKFNEIVEGFKNERSTESQD